MDCKKYLLLPTHTHLVLILFFLLLFLLLLLLLLLFLIITDLLVTFLHHLALKKGHSNYLLQYKWDKAYSITSAITEEDLTTPVKNNFLSHKDHAQKW